MNINVTAFTDNLHYMGIGMLGIFIVIGIIIGITYLLNYVCKPKDTQKEQ